MLDVATSVRETIIVDTRAPCKILKHNTAGGVIGRGGLVRKRWESLFTRVICAVNMDGLHLSDEAIAPVNLIS